MPDAIHYIAAKLKPLSGLRTHQVIHDPDQGAIREGVVFPAKPLIGAPVHSLWFAPIATFQNATGPAHFVADTICSPRRAIPRLFSLRRVGQPVAMTAREDCATVEDSNAATAPTGRAEEPAHRPCGRAWCPGGQDSFRPAIRRRGPAGDSLGSRGLVRT